VSWRIGVDLGGTKIEVAALDEDGREGVSQRVATPHDYDRSVVAIAELVEAVEKEIGERGTVGVGIPGSLSPKTGLVRNANSTWLNGRPLERDLARALRRPIRLMNDANCFALSEATDGAAEGARSVFGVIIGTGVGGGLVVDGRLIDGASGIAGEWGHNPLPWPNASEWPGRACFCGRRGCIETVCSGPGLERDHAHETGRDWSSRTIGEAAERGDTEAEKSLDRYVDRLTRSIATVINLFDPEVVVLGGGVSNLRGLPERVGSSLPDWVFSDHASTRVVRNRHGDSSGVRGAAWLWPPEATPAR